MAKIGTAHVEIKPVLDVGVLDEITSRIADAVAEGVRRGMAAQIHIHSQVLNPVPEVAADTVRRAAYGLDK